MISFRPFSLWLRNALIGAGLALAQSLPVGAQDWNGRGQGFEVAEADCYSVGEQVAAEQGGTLARVSARNQGGRTVCVVVVLVPGRDGERPRRAQFVIPAD